MPVNLERIENPKEMIVGINGPDGANTMLIYTGIAVFGFKGDADNQWKREILSFSVGRKFTKKEFLKTISVSSLSSLYNRGTWYNGGWSIDSFDSKWDEKSGDVIVEANLAVRNKDAYLFRIGYQVTVLAKL